MGATHTWSESNGAGEVVTDGITTVNFGSVDSADLTPVSNPIVAGENSFHKCIRSKFSSTFTEISNMKIWKSAGAYATGEAIQYKESTSYVQPVETALSGAAAIPTSEPSQNVLSAAGTATITVAGYTEYMLMQEQTTVSTPAGAVATKTLTFQYDEI
jgi:hypothetical protein